MPRIRSVHPEICDDITLASLSAEAERTYVRLWTQLDDEGRAEDRPKLLAARLYPEHDAIGPAEVERDLAELASAGLLIRYEAEGKRVLSAKPDAWKKYQRPRHPTASKLPPIPEGYDRTTEDVGSSTDNVRKPPAGVVVGVGVGDGGAEPPATPKDGGPSFDAFWETYPSRRGTKGSRKQALTLWNKLPIPKREAAVKALPQYAQVMGEFPKDAERYLRHEAWDGLATNGSSPSSRYTYADGSPVV